MTYKHSEETKKKIRESILRKKESGWDNHPIETREKLSKAAKGRKRTKESIKKQLESRKGYKHSQATIEKIKNSNQGVKRNKTTREKISLHSKKRWNDPEDYFNSKEFKDIRKEHMIKGGAAYANMFITNPSKPQVELFNLCQILFPYPIMNYPCCGYSIDIAIPVLNLAIEYDGGYWHQDRKDYDIKRQNILEEEGWVFLRYEDYIPTKCELIKEAEDALPYF